MKPCLYNPERNVSVELTPTTNIGPGYRNLSISPDSSGHVTITPSDAVTLAAELLAWVAETMK